MEATRGRMDLRKEPDYQTIRGPRGRMDLSKEPDYQRPPRGRMDLSKEPDYQTIRGPQRKNGPEEGTRLSDYPRPP